MTMPYLSEAMQKEAVPLDEILYLCSNAFNERTFTKYNSQKWIGQKARRQKGLLLPTVPVGQERDDA